MPEKSHSPLPLLLSVLWVIGFLFVFSTQKINDNVDLQRTFFWLECITNLPTLLNPFDFSHVSSDGVDAGWHLLPQRAPFAATAALTFLFSWAIGALISRPALRATKLTTAERFVIQSGLGLSAQSLWTLLAGSAGQLNPTALATPGITAILALVFLAIVRRWSKQATTSDTIRSLPDATPASRPLWIIAGLGALPFVLLILVNGTTPSLDFDVREYHLQGPKEWFQAGHIFCLRHNVYTSFPFLSEMLTLNGMVLMNDWHDGALAGEQLLACFQLLTTVCVYAAARRWFGSSCGIAAAIIYLTVPWTLRISLIAYAEGAATFYLMATVMCAAVVCSTNDSKQHPGLLLTTGLLAGSAMSAKYPGVLSVVIPIGFLLMWSNRTHAQRLPQIAAIYSLGVLLAVSPWLIRNAADTGNPVYPLLYGIFGADDWSPAMDAKWKAGHSPSHHQLSQLPTDMFSVVAGSAWTSGLLFALASPTLLLIRRNATIRQLWLMVMWMLASWWLLTHRIDRFWIPIIPVVAVLAGAVWNLFTSRLWYRFVLAVVVAGTFFNLQVWRTAVPGFQAGLMDLADARELTVRGDIQQLNRDLTTTDRILMVGEAEVFDLQVPVDYNTVFDESLFELWTADNTDDRLWSAERRMQAPDIVQKELKNRGITHIYVNWLEILRYRRPGSYGYTNYVTPARFQQLLSAGVLDDPMILNQGIWEDRSARDRTTISKWNGYEDLLTEPSFDGKRRWQPLRLYRVQ